MSPCFPRLTRRAALSAIVPAAAATALLFATALPGPSAAAQSLPAKPMSLIVPYPAGGISDVIARMVERPLAKVVGQTVIVDNVAGAGGSIAAQKVLNAPAEGSQVYQGSPNELILTPLALKTVKYRSEDWRMVQIIGSFPMAVLARKGL